jgi:dihydrofolate synthase/folylpolyglutamate synthase
MTESILRAAGYKTGLYTSPYIETFNERMRVNGENVSNEELAELTEYVRPIADAMADKPTEFELITAIAFEYFHRHACDVVVLEVGLGGRLDSTNIIETPLLSVITGIDFDHTALLGNTVQEIATEKGGIIKNGFPCLYGGNDNSACRTLSSIAASRNSAFFTVDRSRLSVRSYSIEKTVFDLGDLTELQLPLLGTYQPQNASTVLTAIKLLNENGVLQIPEDAIRRGLASVRWPARFELLRRSDPIILFDGSHNPQGIRSAVQSISTYFPTQKVNILSGVMNDKGYDEMIESLKPVCARAFTVTPQNPRSLPAAEYASHFLAHGIEAQGFETVTDALRAAIENARENGIPLICLGSLYLYGELKTALHQIEKETIPSL